MIINDNWLEKLCRGPDAMIEPFIPDTIREVTRDFNYNGFGQPQTEKVISYGCSSYSYSIRLANKFKLVKQHYHGIIDPKNIDPDIFEDIEAETCIIPPHGFLLGYSIEHFRIPNNVFSVVVGKSTLARCGLQVLITPMENGWAGHLTIEVSNTTPLPVKVYAGEGIAAAIFFLGEGQPKTNYASRSGKYMNQPNDIVLPKM